MKERREYYVLLTIKEYEKIHSELYNYTNTQAVPFGKLKDAKEKARALIERPNNGVISASIIETINGTPYQRERI